MTAKGQQRDRTTQRTVRILRDILEELCEKDLYRVEYYRTCVRAERNITEHMGVIQKIYICNTRYYN